MLFAGLSLKNICEALGRVKTKWLEIGVQLGIPLWKLKEFEKEKEPLSVAIDYCINENSATPFTWKSIVAALDSDYVGESGIAAEIDKKYCQTSAQGLVFCPPGVPFFLALKQKA